jgi:hypothetical protein
LFLGLDFGTSAVKALLVDGGQHMVGSATVPLSVQRPSPGHSEQDPHAWWQAMRDAVDALGRDHAAALSAVEGIGLSGQMHGAVLLDATGAVLRPVFCPIPCWQTPIFRVSRNTARAHRHNTPPAASASLAGGVPAETAATTRSGARCISFPCKATADTVAHVKEFADAEVIHQPELVVSERIPRVVDRHGTVRFAPVGVALVHRDSGSRC